ncbi:MAG: histidine--tRNA ligase [Planctomycetota bacterium]|jgi:histidyl-tRNA synthetase
MADLIQPRTLKGFRDYLPSLMIPREEILQKARTVYRSFGFAPIDTPALEYTEILLGKGGAESDKLIYRFKDHGDRDIALRFDLTVPFARFAAQHVPTLGTPFKRYHMGPVWRGENTAHGRYREFWQCDFDTIGTTSNSSDIEAALVINALLAAIGFERFEIHVNNRLILSGLLEELGLADKSVAVLRALDKLPKVGIEPVVEEMVLHGVDAEKGRKVLELAGFKGTNEEILAFVSQKFGNNPKAADGVKRLSELLIVARESGVPDERLRIDLSIARGLDYYTGTIFETFLSDLPGIGSICSGGRYDNLAGLYTKMPLPGVGASLGLDRLLAAMEELKILGGVQASAPVFIVRFADTPIGVYEKLAATLRAAGIGVEVFIEPKKIGQQLQYAEKRGFRFALIAGPDDFASKKFKIKELATRQEADYDEAIIVSQLRTMLGIGLPG